MSASKAPGELVRAMTCDDLDRVLGWRNHPDVRSFMLSQRYISPDEHRQWYDRSVTTGSKRLLIFEAGSEPMGFVSFNSPDAGGITEWGFYARPGAPKGTGGKLGAAAIRHAFRELDVHKICGRTLVDNYRSIRCHEKWGFRREGVLREQHFDGERYRDIVCFGLLHSEWKP